MNAPSRPIDVARSSDYAEILTSALVSDKPEIMQLEKLSPSIKAQIASGQAEGLHLVSVRWETGQFALLFCNAGCDMPEPEKVVAAYFQCGWADIFRSAGGIK